MTIGNDNWLQVIQQLFTVILKHLIFFLILSLNPRWV